MVLGVWVMLLSSPMLALPMWFKAILGVVTGLAIIFIAYRSPAYGRPRSSAAAPDAYVERRTEPASQPEITSPDRPMSS